MSVTTVRGIKMLGDDKKHFLVVRVEPSVLANEQISAKAKQFYENRMGYRIVLAAEKQPKVWQTCGPKELLAQFDGDQLGLGEWEEFPRSRDWITQA
jgi:hypothetical protein